MKKKTMKIIIITILTLPLFALFTNNSFANNPSWPGWEVDYPWNPPQEPSLPQYINYIYNVSFFVAGFLAVLMIIMGGIQWMSSAASPQQKMAAKNRITRSIIGIVTLFAIFVVLRSINPDLVKLKEIEVKEFTPGSNLNDEKSELEKIKNGDFQYRINGTDITSEIERGAIEGLPTNPETGHYSKFRNEYISTNNTLPGESKTPCECAGTEGGADNRCGTYCFHACRRYVSGEEIDNKIYGVLSACAKTSGYDEVACKCYEAFNDNFSEATTFEIDNACECAGNQTPLCRNTEHEFCVDYCKRVEGYKFGYISRCEEGGEKDLIWCTCIK